MSQMLTAIYLNNINVSLDKSIQSSNPRRVYGNKLYEISWTGPYSQHRIVCIYTQNALNGQCAVLREKKEGGTKSQTYLSLSKAAQGCWFWRTNHQ